MNTYNFDIMKRVKALNCGDTLFVFDPSTGKQNVYHRKFDGKLFITKVANTDDFDPKRV